MAVVLVREISHLQATWRNSPGVMKHCRQNDILGEYHQNNWLDKINEDPTIEMFGIADDKESVGTCGLTGISYIHRTAEYSILIGPENQGKGYATEAMRLLLDYGFKNLDLE